MSFNIKSGAEIDAMRVACRLASEVLDYLTPLIQPGITTKEIDRLAHDYMVNVQGTTSATLNYQPPGHVPYPASLCTSVNEVVCHGIPGPYALKNGDIINVDVVGFYNWRFDLAERVRLPTSTTATATQGGGRGGGGARFSQAPIGKGRAYGIEVLLKRDLSKNFFGWIAYTLSWSDERAKATPWTKGTGYAPADSDQRHILTVIGQYKFGNGWELGARFRLTTGTPDTPVVGSTYDSDTQSYRPIYGPDGSTRQPTFHQLDLRVDRVFLFDRWQLGAYLDVQNVYNHTNQEGTIADYRFRSQIIVPDIPILPTLGIKGSF